MTSQNSSYLRIVNDIIEFNKNKIEDIYISFDKKLICSVNKLYAMIIGPSKTPYYGGYFFFEITFPSNYPLSSPSVKFLTTDGDVRFNPNLYANGKVCLSILGTWAGPKWEPVMTLSSVLLSIQSLMGENPLRNEPGYENIEHDNIKALQYTQYVQYNTYMVGIINVLNNKMMFNLLELFNKEILENLNKNYENLKNDLMSYAEILNIVPIIDCGYSIKQKNLDFTKLLTDFSSTTEKYIKI